MSRTTPLGTGTYLDRTTQITRERMGKGNLGHREGSGHDCGLLSTGSGEFSIEVTLNHSQAILVSLCMPYNGDDQSGCHSWTEEKTKPQMLLIAQRETIPATAVLSRGTLCCKWESSARPEPVSSSSTCNSNVKAKQKQDLKTPWTLASLSLLSLYRRRSAFQVNGIGRDNVPLFAHCRCRRRPGCLSSFSGRH